MDQTLLFIFNPKSGKAQVKQKLFDIVDCFVKAGYQTIVHPTQEQHDARKIVRECAQKVDLIVASGGDGTINEVVDGLMELEPQKRPLLGYIPTGTVNDFASSLKLSKNILRATYDILEGQPFACDVGSFNDEFFTYVAAFGLFTDVAYETPQQSKNIFGRAAYILEGIKRLGNIQAYPMCIEYDNGAAIQDSFILGMVTNSVSIGGFKSISPNDVSLDDGLLEVTLIKQPKNPFELQMIIDALLKQNEDSEYIYLFRTSKLKITSEVEVPWTLDGEYGGTEQKITIENHHKAIRIITPIEQQKLLITSEIK